MDYAVWCRSVKEANTLELAMHQTLTEDGKWLHGEWFDMRATDAIELLHFKASVLGIECFDTVDDPDVLKDVETMLSYYADGSLSTRIVDHQSRP